MKKEWQLNFHPSDLELFQLTGDPLIPLDVFVRDYKKHRPITGWVVAYLASVFELYIEKCDTKRLGALEVLMGFSPGKGDRSTWRRVLMATQDLNLFLEIFALFTIGIKEDSAIDAVIERNPGQKKGYLKKRYFSCRRRNREFFKRMGQHISKWNLKRKETFRRQYPLLNSGCKVT